MDEFAPIKERSDLEKPLIKVKGLSKAYGAIQALSNISFTLERSQILAFVGENGAGKSTLARILAGAIVPDNGEIIIDDKPVVFRSPRDALAHGISFIPQELAYFSNLTVGENILISRWPNFRGFTSTRAIKKAAQQEVQQYGIDLDVSRSMSTLSLVERQLVEIIKALAHKSRVVILDEPTAALSDRESQILFDILRELKNKGVGIIYISHHIDEIFRLSDQIDVLRNGQLVASLTPSMVKPSEVITYMLGHEAEQLGKCYDQSEQERELILSLENWCSDRHPKLSNVNISIYRGEIVGLYGLRGCGADIVAEGLAGLHRDIRGELYLNKRKHGIFSSPRQTYKAKIVYMPPERKRNGLVFNLSVQANISLAILHVLSFFGVLNNREEQSIANQLSRILNIHLQNVKQQVNHLSGGNQQKVLLASRLATKPQILVLHEPTRGVDVGARIEIHKFLRDLASQGVSILWVTTDVEEAVLVSDRLLIMRNGAIITELCGELKTQHNALVNATVDAA